MRFPLLKLELRQNRLAAATVAASFLVTLPVSRLVAATTGMEPAKALEAILIGWMLLGSPFAAALIASAAGAQTASRDAREAEALLPVSPLRRAAASLGASFLLLCAVTALLVGTSWLLGALTPLLASRDPALNWAMPYWQDSSMTPLFFFVLLDALLGCWILSYAIGHGVAGGLLGLGLTAATLLAAAIGFGLQLVHGDWGIDVLPLYAWLAAAAVALKLAAAASCAAWRERSASPRRHAPLVAAALLFGPLAGWAAMRWTYADLLARLRTAESPLRFTYQPWTEHEGPAASRAALAAEGKGAAMWNAAGGLFLAGPDGVRALIPEEKRGPADYLVGPMLHAESAARDERGVLWATRSDFSVFEVWREENGGMKLVRSEPWKGLPEIKREARRLVISAWFGEERDSQYMSIEDYAASGLKAPRDVGLTRTLERGAREAGAARVACAPAYDCLRRGNRTWKLPGTSQWSGGAVMPYIVGGKPAFLVPVSLKSGAAIAVLCREDGRVEKAWDLERGAVGSFDQGFGALPDGTLYSTGPEDSIGVIDPAGRVSSLRYDRLRPAEGRHPRPELVRRAGGHSWLLWNRALIEASGSGEEISRIELPEHRDHRVLDEGLLLDTGGALIFRAWDGTTRRLRKPR